MAIGCITGTIESMLENYTQYGLDNEYSDEEIQEYFSYIKQVQEFAETNKL